MNGKIKKTIYYSLLVILSCAIGYLVYKLYSTEYADYFVTILALLFLLFILILFVRIKFKNEFNKRRGLFYFLLLIYPLILISIKGYRHYFLISQRSSETIIKKGKYRECKVFGTSSQNKLFEIIVEGVNVNHNDTNLIKPNWNFDTTWVYYNSSGIVIEKRKKPKKYSKYYILSSQIREEDNSLIKN